MSEKWTQEEKDAAIEQVDKMLDSSEVVIRNGGYSYNAEIIELALQRNRMLAVLKVARGWVSTRIGDTHEDMQQIDAAISACEEKL
jgi:hypothetical protein